VHDALIISPNVAIDSYYVVPELQVGDVNRATLAIHTAGGKGINIGRALRLLGGHPYCLGLAGGAGADFIRTELSREGIAGNMLRAATETRRTTTIVEPYGRTTVIADPGGTVPDECGLRLANAALELVGAARYVLLVGSLPVGLAPDYYARLVQEISPMQGAVIAIDSSGEALAQAIEAGPAIVKINRSELAFTLGEQAAESFEAMVAAHEGLAKRGVRLLIVTDGPRGAYVFSTEHPPFSVVTDVNPIVSAVGAGDTFLAGLVLALSRGAELEVAVVQASAAAAANLLKVGSGVLDPVDAARLVADTRILRRPASDAA
jgi:1-phosphofructokinase family hexose kinase